MDICISEDLLSGAREFCGGGGGRKAGLPEFYTREGAADAPDFRPFSWRPG